MPLFCPFIIIYHQDFILLYFITLNNLYCTATSKNCTEPCDCCTPCVGFTSWVLKMWPFPYPRIWKSCTHLRKENKWYDMLSGSSILVLWDWCVKVQDYSVQFLGFVVPCLFNHSNKNNQLDATINRKIYRLVVRTLLNVFRALLCPSSGAHQTAVAASGFRTNVEVEAFSAVVGLLANRPRLRTLPPPHSYGNQRPQRQSDGLLMMGIVTPETRWAVSVRQGDKFYDWSLHLVGCFYLSTVSRLWHYVMGYVLENLWTGGKKQSATRLNGVKSQKTLTFTVTFVLLEEKRN